MGTEPSTSKLRVETAANGNGTVVSEEAPVEAHAVAVPATTPSASPVIEATPLTGSDTEVTVLSRGDAASGSWVISGDGELLGEFSGEIECGGSLLVGKGAEVRARIRGNDVTIAGLVRGNIVAQGRLRITSSGRLEGDARVGALVVQEGGVHHGVIRVHPEGVPEVDDSVSDAIATVEPAAEQTPVDRVRKFWGEFF